MLLDIPQQASHGPRAQGVLRVQSKRRAEASVLDGLHQGGSLKCLFPRSADPALTAVFLNTAGGMTGGDRFRIAATAGLDSRLVLTTQAAERIYRAQGTSVANLDTALTIAPGARLDWLPQETILFDHAALRRRLHVQMDDSATCLLVEPLVFGRAAMGETVTQARLQDEIRVTRGDSLVFADQIRLHGDVQAQLQGPGVAGGAGAVAALVYIAPDAEAYLSPLRALLPDTGGVSLIRPGVLFARLLAADSFELRRALVPMAQALHGGPVPRTWMI